MICIRCKVDKPLECFVKDKRHKDGRLHSCKECNKPKEYIYVESKTCSKCGETKPRDAFRKASRNKYGLKETCAECDKARGKAYRETMKNRSELPTITEKKCFMCGEIKNVDQFYSSRHRKDGYTENCIKCRDILRRKKLEENPDLYKDRWSREKSKPGVLEKKRERSAEYRRLNKDKAHEKDRSAYIKHKNYYRAYNKAWYKTEKGLALVKKNHAVRRSRAGDGKITAAQIRELEQENRDKYGVLTCVYCLSPILGSYHLEHRVPLSRGGANTKENATIACPTCNVRKHTRTDEEFMAELHGVAI